MGAQVSQIGSTADWFQHVGASAVRVNLTRAGMAIGAAYCLYNLYKASTLYYDPTRYSKWMLDDAWKAIKCRVWLKKAEEVEDATAIYQKCERLAASITDPQKKGEVLCALAEQKHLVAMRACKMAEHLPWQNKFAVAKQVLAFHSKFLESPTPDWTALYELASSLATQAFQEGNPTSWPELKDFAVIFFYTKKDPLAVECIKQAIALVEKKEDDTVRLEMLGEIIDFCHETKQNALLLSTLENMQAFVQTKNDVNSLVILVGVINGCLHHYTPIKLPSTVPTLDDLTSTIVQQLATTHSPKELQSIYPLAQVIGNMAGRTPIDQSPYKENLTNLVEGALDKLSVMQYSLDRIDAYATLTRIFTEWILNNQLLKDKIYNAALEAIRSLPTETVSQKEDKIDAITRLIAVYKSTAYIVKELLLELDQVPALPDGFSRWGQSTLAFWKIACCHDALLKDIAAQYFRSYHSWYQDLPVLKRVRKLLKCAESIECPTRAGAMPDEKRALLTFIESKIPQLADPDEESTASARLVTAYLKLDPVLSRHKLKTYEEKLATRQARKYALITAVVAASLALCQR